MANQIPDRIVREILLSAPIATVWRAIADAKQFGQWFGCEVDGGFVVGNIVTCKGTYEGGTHLSWQKRIKALEPETYFAYEWSPGDTGAATFTPESGMTLVEFTLVPRDGATHLTICESGFAELPERYRERSFRINEGGWNDQVNNIRAFFNA